MKQIDPLDVLKRTISAYPNQETAASALGFSQQYLNDLLHQRRKFSRRILEALGLKEEKRIIAK